MKKQCPGCRESIEDTAIVCPYCGAMQSAEPTWENNASWWNAAPMPGMGSRRAYPSTTAKRLSIALAVFCFISAGTTLLLLLLFFAGAMMEELWLMEEYIDLMYYLSDYYYLPLVLMGLLVDAAFYAIFGILLLVKKSWKISLVITIYSGVWFLAGIVSFSSGGIPMVLVLGILSTIWLRKGQLRGM